MSGLQYSPRSDVGVSPVSPTSIRTLEVLLDRGSATRPELSDALGVTKQTVSTAVAELEGRGLVEPVATQQGALGRSALRYALARTSGWVVGVDLGGVQVRVAAARLDGTVAAERIVRPDARARGAWADRAAATATAVEDLARGLDAGPVLGAAVAVARPVPTVRDLLAGRAAAEDAGLLALLGEVAPPSVWVENDVSCEAIAQLRYRSAPVPDVVLHLHVGIGIGTALVVGGRVVRGARGRAGEIGRLTAPGGTATVESTFGAADLLARAGHSGAAPVAAALDDLFAGAALGDPAAEHAVADEAAGLAALLETLAAVVDPDLVVLSGLLGARADLRARVIDRCERGGLGLTIAEDPLGDGAIVLGAATVAVDGALAALAGSA